MRGMRINVKKNKMRMTSLEELYLKPLYKPIRELRGGQYECK